MVDGKIIVFLTRLTHWDPQLRNAELDIYTALANIWLPATVRSVLSPTDIRRTKLNRNYLWSSLAAAAVIALKHVKHSCHKHWPWQSFCHDHLTRNLCSRDHLTHKRAPVANTGYTITCSSSETCSWVVETSVTNNSSFKNYPHPDDHSFRN